ncbi:hypothetical protein CK501_01630 [Halovibrio salipaludis]|uniref:DUF748 domain-containing protein n=1 Tax=Halovibrio salipaludis TaxID=2032626 RepID=A0A2A2FD53_9GAMM|nr:DUF748 domain-containing protein [Halovibrio salipaludis]PAU82483.1 hypothetical protein CK501_01630 [Halovibrio salipaludis]
MPSDSLRRFGGYLRTRWASPRRIRFWLLALVIAYTLLGFLIVPWLIQYLAVSTAKEDFGRELRIEAVHVNPYTLTLRIDGLALDDTDNRQLLGWQQLFVDLAWSSALNGAWTFQTIRLDRPMIHEERFASGKTRFSRLAPEPSEDAPTEDEASPLPALQVDELRVTEAALRFTDNLPGGVTETDQPKRVSLALEELMLSASDLSLQEGARFPVALEGQLEGGGTLAFDGSLQLLPTAVLAGSARIDELALNQAQPYLRQFANVQLSDGTLNLDGRMQTGAEQPFAFEGSAGIKTLNINDGSNQDPLIGWQSLHTKKLDLNLGERRLETAPISLNGLFGRLIINEDRTTNFSQLMATAPANARAEDDGAARMDDTDDETAPFDITVEGVELTDGTLRFADRSLPLPFSTSIHTLNGQVSTLSSSSAQPAQVALEGQVADYGLTRVDGTIHAWHPMRDTSLKLRFRNLQIPEYSPYTVRFAGRRIAGGTMDLDLDYTVSEQQLDGRNSLVLRDLTLGEKMAVSDAMDLPLDLAIALLKDSNGVIDLDLPVTGDVGSPEFDVGGVVRQALTKTIKSVVQSPFRFLANLVGADSEELGRVEFPPGRSDLLPPQRERVAKLREALTQRPELALELTGPFNHTFDGPILKRGKAIDALRQRLAQADRETGEPNLTAEANQDVVETMFTTHYPEADLAAIRSRFTEEQGDSSEDTGFDALAYRNHLADRIIAAQSITESDLRALANARATAVQQALVDPGADNPIDSNRVRLQDPETIESVDGERIAMEVGLAAD